MPTPVITVLSAHRHPRLRYVLRLLSDDLGWRFRLVTDPAKAGPGPGLSYGMESGDPPYPALPAHPFLAGASASEEDLTVRWQDDVPFYFAVGNEVEPHIADVPAPNQSDLLACIFFTVTRYEEYSSPAADAHGRFPASASHARRNGYLHLPVVRTWTSLISKLLRDRFPELPPPHRPPAYLQPTYDIDLLWAYRYRGLRGVAAGVRDVLTGHPGRALDRLRSASTSDPYDTLDRLRDLHGPDSTAPGAPPSHPLPSPRPRFFWLLADNGDRKDPNPYPIPEEQRSRMRALSEWADHGLHPGYRSTDDAITITAEAARFTDVFGRAPVHSRQHFLRFRLPDTYRDLRQNGLQHDHSMGYADAIGWRAGTNLPHPWYDLEREEMTGLTVHPFAAMDVTLKNYLGLGAEEAIRRVRELFSGLEGYGGPCALLWHNSSFAAEYGWAGWWEAYRVLWNTPSVGSMGSTLC